MLIQKEFYLLQLNLRRNNDMINVITGVRRFGKSFFLFRLFKDMLLQEGVPTDHLIEVILDNIEETICVSRMLSLHILKTNFMITKCIIFFWMKYSLLIDFRRY